MATSPCLTTSPLPADLQTNMSRLFWPHNIDETLSEVSNDAMTGDVTDDDDLASTVYTIIMKYVAPILIMFGSTGNMLSLAVLQSRYYRRSPSAFILSALALTDTGVLLCGLLRHWILQLTHDEVDIRSFNLVTCYIHSLFTYYLCQLSSWSLVLLTVERMGSVRWPLRCREWFSKGRMVAAWVTIALVLAALNGHWFVTVGLVQEADDSDVYRCRMLEEWYWFSLRVWPWLDLIVLSLIPLIIILTCNIYVIHRLLRAAKMRRTLSTLRKAKGDDSNSQITPMLIGLSVIFFVTTMPVSIYFIGEDTFWDSQKPSSLIAYAICNISYYLTNSTNFLVYCVIGSKFRRALRAVVCCKRGDQKKRKSTMKSIRSSTYKPSSTSSPVTLVSVVFNIQMGETLQRPPPPYTTS